MARDAESWIRRIKAVERECSAARSAADFLIRSAEIDPSVLAADLRLRDVRRMADRLNGTYLVRLFAEFETALRKYWELTRNTPSPGRTRDLIESVGARESVPNDRQNAVHAVREYRNSLVHEREAPAEAVTLADARGHLCRFLSHLKPIWH